jgi:hypothetical protein
VSYSFYVPIAVKRSTSVLGNVEPVTEVVNGRRITVTPPQLLGVDPRGDLMIYPTDGDATTPTIMAANAATSPDGVSWADSTVFAHRGGYGGAAQDDLIALTSVNGRKSLALYLNTYALHGQSEPPFLDNQVTIVNAPPCGNDCQPTWNTTTSIAALGATFDSTPPTSVPSPSLATVQGDSVMLFGGWSVGPNTASGETVAHGAAWAGSTVIDAGDPGHTGCDSLWVRQRDGALYLFTSDAASCKAWFLSGAPWKLTEANHGRPVATGLTPARYPYLTGQGDISNAGYPDLWGMTPSGQLVCFPGLAPTAADQGPLGPALPMTPPSWTHHLLAFEGGTSPAS